MKTTTKGKGATVLAIKDPRSTYVVISRSDRKTVIAEGTSISKVIAQARATHKSFAMMSILPKGCTWI